MNKTRGSAACAFLKRSVTDLNAGRQLWSNGRFNESYSESLTLPVKPESTLKVCHLDKDQWTHLVAPYIACSHATFSSELWCLPSKDVAFSGWDIAWVAVRHSMTLLLAAPLEHHSFDTRGGMGTVWAARVSDAACSRWELFAGVKSVQDMDISLLLLPCPFATLPSWQS